MSTITFPLTAKQRGNAVLHLQDGLLLLLEKNRSVFIPPPPLTHIPKPPDWPAIIQSLEAERSKKYGSSAELVCKIFHQEVSPKGILFIPFSVAPNFG